MIVKMTEDEESWCLLCGASDGRIYQRRLLVDTMGYLSDMNDFRNNLNDSLAWTLKPSHSAPVVALSSPFPGMFVSGGLDGTLRVWDSSHELDWEEWNDVDTDEASDDDHSDHHLKQDKDNKDETNDSNSVSLSRPKCLYALTGYKVWLGSIYSTAKKLVSDGADNTIVVHDFSGEEEQDEIEFSFEEDDEDEEEGDDGILK
jgi:hypothetical protein